MKMLVMLVVGSTRTDPSTDPSFMKFGRKQFESQMPVDIEEKLKE